MKRKLIIIISVVFVLVLIVVGVVAFFGWNKKDDNPDQTTTEAFELSVTSLETFKELETFCNDNDCVYYASVDKMVATIDDIVFYGRNVFITYYFDNAGNAQELEVVHYLNTSTEEDAEVKEFTLDEFYSESIKAIDNFADMFGCERKAKIYATNNDGTFTEITNTESIRKVYKGEAYIRFAIRDVNGRLWLMFINSDNGLYGANIRKFYNVQENLDEIADISLYKQGE